MQKLKGADQHSKSIYISTLFSLVVVKLSSFLRRATARSSAGHGRGRATTRVEQLGSRKFRHGMFYPDEMQ